MTWAMHWYLVLAALPAFAQGTSVDLASDASEVTCSVIHPARAYAMVSREVMYRVRVDPSSRMLLNVEGLAELASFSGGDPGWDGRIRGVLDPAQYPVASFEGADVTEAGDSALVAGELFFHGVREPAVIRIRCVWSDNALSVSGWCNLRLSAFGITRSSLQLFPVADTVHVSFRATFRLN